MSLKDHFLVQDQKETLRQLNERLAEFIQHCHYLEQSNNDLQNKIENQMKKVAPQIPDWKEKEQESEELLNSVSTLCVFLFL